jgi:hypothetical protein
MESIVSNGQSWPMTLRRLLVGLAASMLAHERLIAIVVSPAYATIVYPLVGRPSYRDVLLTFAMCMVPICLALVVASKLVPRSVEPKVWHSPFRLLFGAGFILAPASMVIMGCRECSLWTRYVVAYGLLLASVSGVVVASGGMRRVSEHN